MGPRQLLLALSSAALLVLTPSTASAHHPTSSPEPQLLTAGLSGAWGSTVGPDGALYVAAVTGEVSRIDPRTGATTTFASGLPTAPNGGPHDVAFVDGTAYVLVGFITEEAGGAPTNVDGIYRVDGPSRVHAGGGRRQFAKENPPTTDYFIATGVPTRSRPTGRLPGHRRPPQPRLPGGSRRLGVGPDRVRQHRPDGSGRRRLTGLHGGGRPSAAPGGGRQGRHVRQALHHGDRGRRGRTADGRRPGRPRAPRSTPSRRATGRSAGRQALLRRRTPASCSRSAGTGRSRSWPTG